MKNTQELPWTQVLSHSHYLRQLFNARPELPQELLRLWQSPLTAAMLQGELSPPARDDEELKQQLRHLRQKTLALLALRDLSGLAPLAEVVEGMTLLADITTNAALEYHYQQLIKTYGTPLDSEGHPQKLLVIGMGKLGGRELNVSSDVDYIFVYPEDGSTTGPKSVDNFEFFTRLGKRLIAALGETTADGIVFRVDMRLRPNGDSGPLVCSLDTLENYFITQGREWERYAWIKARILNTGPNTDQYQNAWADALYNISRLFVYRKYLDFGAINAMRDLHAQIRREVTRKDRTDHIKLGPGGIREIEFIAQVFQLIRGGREPGLQIRPTLEVLQQLAARGILSPETSQELQTIYEFLRKLEHRLQYLEDKQTHSLPQGKTEQALIASSMGFTDWPAMLEVLNGYRKKVSQHFDAVFSEPDQGEQPFRLLWLGHLSQAQAVDTLEDLGFRNPLQIQEQLEQLQQSSKYQQLPIQSRERLDAVGPRLLEISCNAPHQELVFIRGLHFLENISRRSAYLALLQQYPQTLQKVADIIGTSPWAAQYLNRHPILLDELLDSRLLEGATQWSRFRNELSLQLERTTGDTERQMDLLREAHHAQLFRLLAQDLAGLHSIEKISDHLTELADIILEYTLKLCWNNLKTRHRNSPAFAIIGYGKLGGKELGYASDLDIIYLYDDPDQDALRTYTRLGQRINTWLSSQTSAGILFETDLRLRPNGESGLLVSSIEAFVQYQEQQAWVWEHQALTRARFIAGDAEVGARFETIRKNILCQYRALEPLRSEVLSMRKKIQDNHPPRHPDEFDLKHSQGGIIDVEFIVQYLVLGHAHTYPELTANLGNITLLKIAAKLGLIPERSAIETGNAYREFRRLQHAKRLEDTVSSPVLREEVDRHIKAVTSLWQTLFQ